MTNKSESKENMPAVAGVDLGGDERFPREHAPYTARGVEAWVWKSLTTPREAIRDANVPPAFQLGVVRGLVAACDRWLQDGVPEHAAEKIRWLRETFSTALMEVD